MSNQQLPTLFLLQALLLFALLSGCGSVESGAAVPTVLSVPSTSTEPTTVTPPRPTTSTATAAPIVTPTVPPSPSPTMDSTATAAVRETDSSAALNKQVLPDLEAYGVNPADGKVVWVGQRPVHLDLTGYLENRDQVLEGVGKLSDFVVQSEITWNTSGALSLCGITFRAEEDFAEGRQDRFLMMRLQFDPQWTIWRWEYGKFERFVSGSWMSSRDIHDKNDSTNVVALVAQGKNIRIFINHDEQRKIEEPELSEGLLALSAFQESGRTTCKFVNTWVWKFDQ